MTNITIKAADFPTDIHIFPTIGESIGWVSDGKMAVRLDRVDNAAMLATAETVAAFMPKLAASHGIKRRDDASGMATILASVPDNAATWTVQPWFYVWTDRTIARKPRTVECVVLTGRTHKTDGDRDLPLVIGIDRKYATRFGLQPGDTLHGHAAGDRALATPERDLVVMPIKLGDMGETLAPFRAIVRAEDRADAEQVAKSA